ncbi:MAG: hypothetical protein V3V28_01480 [Polaribacter sp.]|uniref:hypothetical protein n=1 Tax=Polaribacter sp. TaxID=1920175 RepID=UPI002F355756
MKKIITLLIFATLLSCDENNQNIEDTNNLLIGNWTHLTYDDEETTFSRVNSLPENKYGVSFKTNGDYLEKSSGFCGTPPLSFYNINGSYELKEGLININLNNYSFGWRIISLTKTTLVVKRELTQQEIEHRELMDLYNEFFNLSVSVSCTDSKDWSFVGYGAKACGGFQGYIAYSKNIDVVSFLDKIKTYTEAEKEFNVKWGIVSDCSLIPQPTSVICNNGYPVLEY